MNRFIFTFVGIVQALVASMCFAQPVTGDLEITAMLVSPDPAPSGANVQVDLLITNLGPGIGQLTNVEITVDGVVRVDAVPLDIFPSPGTSTIKSYSVPMPTVPAGASASALVRTEIRGGGDINFSNNIETEFVSVIGPPRPDLECFAFDGYSGPIVVSIQQGTTTTDSPITDADQLFIDLGVLNSGGSTAPSGVQVQLLLDGTELFNLPFEPLDANSGFVLPDIQLGSLPAGTYTLEMVLDGDNGVTESDETNNSCSFTFTVESTGGDDIDLGPLIPTGYTAPLIASSGPGTSLLETVFEEGQTVYVDFAYANFGTDPSGTFRVELCLNGDLVGFLDDTLDAQSGTLITDVEIENLTPGDHLLEVKLDVGDVVGETDEGNNVYALVITVTGSVCVADFNGDGVLNFFDVSAFLTDFNAGLNSADLNNDGLLNFFDVSAFLTAYTAGCP